MSFGTRDAKESRAIKAMLQRFVRARRWPILDAILDEVVTVIEVYDADTAGTLHELTARIAAHRTSDADVDLSALVGAWAKAGANAKYIRQVRRLMPEGKRFPRSAFTKGAVRTFLDELTQVPRKRATSSEAPPPALAADSTRNRYRAALSAFAAWLIERDVLEANPVRSVAASPEPPPRVVYLERAEALTLINALPPGQHRFVSALMFATGLELGAVLAMRRRFVDLEQRTFHAFPWLARATGKTKYRSRIVAATDDELWPIIQAHVRTIPPHAPLVTFAQSVLLRMVQSRVKLLGLAPEYTLHDWRHTYAVQWLKGGGDHQVLKHQLGHAPRSTLIYTTYGTWLVKPSDIRAGAPKIATPQREGPVENATLLTTTPRNDSNDDA
ncbi:MAG TPA: site-specific integrase [Candidatus Limnocylindria bacterium]|nr:site-specific integrase [Candidatus Limnocylindria bacterium]